MTSLVDLMQLEAPATIELVGKRLSGTVEVIYARSSHLTPVIRFGSDRFGVHTSVVTANGIECEVAGETFYRNPDGTWGSDTYKNVRRNIDYRAGGSLDWDVPSKTWHIIRDALAVECPRLHERYPDAFLKRLGVGSSYCDGASFDRVVERAENDLRIVRLFAGLYRSIEDGFAVVTTDWPDELPDEIRWDSPSTDAMPNHDVQKSRGRVVGVVVQATASLMLLGYAVDRSGTTYKPDTYHGPLLVPIELARHPGRP
jgi:hypothetical protein